jgi:hypothetical protein
VSWASASEISFNSYKPFACGIVIQHRRLRQLRRQGRDARAGRAHRAESASLVLELTDEKSHRRPAGCSASPRLRGGLTFGRAAEDRFPTLVAGRHGGAAPAGGGHDDAIDEASADDRRAAGRPPRAVFVEHAIGSLQNL